MTKKRTAKTESDGEKLYRPGGPAVWANHMSLAVFDDSVRLEFYEADSLGGREFRTGVVVPLKIGVWFKEALEKAFPPPSGA